MKKLLIYAHYYFPDVASTGQILKELAEDLKDSLDITVICVVPSYSGRVAEHYKKQKYYIEELNGIKLIRIRVPDFVKAKKLSRVRNILAYYFGAIGATKLAGKQDYILGVSQPPILGGLLGVLGKWMNHAKFIYQIQDFNPEQIMAVNYVSSKSLMWILAKLDKFSCKHADLVITVGRDLVDTLKGRFKNTPKSMPRIAMINNWIDEKETRPLPDNHDKVQAFREEFGLQDKFNIMYSGNLGQYYDLPNILKVIEHVKPGTKAADGREVVFSFIGDGTVLQTMKDYCQEHGMTNVVFIPYQDKSILVYSLNAGDVHWCVSAKGIKGVSCPSKYYGIAAVGKPVMAVLEKDSEIQRIIEECQSGLICEPEQYEEIASMLDWFIEHAGAKEALEMGDRGRKYLEEHLTREVSTQRYLEEILAL